SMAVLQDAPLSLAPEASAALGLSPWLEPDHPGGRGAPDLWFADRARALPEAVPPGMKGGTGSARAATLYSDAPMLAATPLDPDMLTRHFGADRLAAEEDGGKLLSFFRTDG